jgi:metallo-beta-lactamase class B
MIRSVLAVLVLGLVPTPAAAQASNWTNPRDPFQIADNLYYVGSEGLAAFLFTSEAGHLLIDAPLEVNVPVILANIRSLGFDPTDIRMQLASHAHFDHVGGLAAMREATGAELVLSEADAVFVREGRDFGLDRGGYPAARVSRTVSHLETVRLGPIELTAHLTPGHTPGCTSWGGVVEIEGEPYAFISVCSLSVLGNYELGGDRPTYDGQARDYCTSVAYLESLEPDVFLAPHADWFGADDKAARRASGDATAFVEGESYRDYLSRARATIERRVADAGLGSCRQVVGR